MRKLLMQGALLAQSQPISFSSELFHIDITKPSQLPIVQKSETALKIHFH